MRVSAIMCTFNRAWFLERVVESLVRQTLPPHEYEIIVVDNASTDETGQISRRLAQGAANLRYVHEAQPGLSNARNRGVKEARGDIVAFIDDDALASEAWLAALVEAFQRQGRRPACIGGRVLPIWETDRPDWLPNSLLGSLSLLDLGDESRPCEFPREYLIGCNIAFWREDLLQNAGGFDPLLGRRGGNLAGSEEIAIQRRIHRQGGVIYYEAGAVVRHFVPKERLTRRWLIRRWFDQGMSDVLAAQREGQHTSLSRLARNAANAVFGVPLVLKSLLTKDRQDLALRCTSVAYAVGALLQTLRGGLFSRPARHI